jgi:hypothetical protein
MYRGGPRTSDFLSRFFSLLDISGSLSSGKGPLIQGNYWLQVGPRQNASTNYNALAWPDYDDGSVMVNAFHELMIYMANLSKLSAESMTEIGRQDVSLIREKAMSIERELEKWWSLQPPELRDQDNHWRRHPRMKLAGWRQSLEQESFSSLRCCKYACIIYLHHIMKPVPLQARGPEVSQAVEEILDIARNTPEGYGLEMGLLWGLFMAGVAIFDDSAAETLIRRRLSPAASISIYVSTRIKSSRKHH